MAHVVVDLPRWRVGQWNVHRALHLEWTIVRHTHSAHKTAATHTHLTTADTHTSVHNTPNAYERKRTRTRHHTLYNTPTH